MNKNSNTYIITYSIVMVVVVAVVLAFTAIKLQPIQQRNVEVEKMGAILGSAGLTGKVTALETAGTVHDQAVIDSYKKYITGSFLVDSVGNVTSSDNKAVFEVLNAMKAEIAKPASQRQMPVFISKDGEEEKYIFPVYGTGLWGPVWGYIALGKDLNTISGAIFDHKSETPGLGAEISTPPFQVQFAGKTIFEGDKYVGIKVLKGGGSKDNAHAVDAITGGTITSRAVETMIISSLALYEPYIVKTRAAMITPKVDTVAVDSMTIAADSLAADSTSAVKLK